MNRMDSFRIDSHKLMFHVGRVHDWLQDKPVYPIYVEITTSGACNHRCTFCALDYLGYEARFLDTRVLKTRVGEMVQKGVKSIMYAGEGEPLLHKQMGEIINHTKQAGIDVALATNAVLLTPGLCGEALRSLTWLKASVNAGTAETYAKIHRTRPEHFDLVFKNLESAAQIRAKNGWTCTLGVQMVLLPENQDEAVLLAQRAKDAGMDYAVIKPYSQHRLSLTHCYESLRYASREKMAQDFARLNDDKFHVVFRQHTMKKLEDCRRHYEKCQATPHFWAYVMADGSVYGCSAYLGGGKAQEKHRACSKYACDRRMPRQLPNGRNQPLPLGTQTSVPPRQFCLTFSVIASVVHYRCESEGRRIIVITRSACLLVSRQRRSNLEGWILSQRGCHVAPPVTGLLAMTLLF